MRTARIGLWIAAGVMLAGATAAAGPARPRSVVLLIGDGMGFEQVRAASQYAHAPDGALVFARAPHRADMTTDPARGGATDSAAGATAFATGRKVANGVISLAIPGDRAPLRTALEIFQKRGARTGLVTTSYQMGATLAAFAAHVARRGDTRGIAEQYFTRTRPNLVFGAGVEVVEGLGEKAGYGVVRTRDGLAALQPGKARYVRGTFGMGGMPYEFDYAEGDDEGYDRLPHLSEMTARALALLDGPKGLFLVVEGGRIDHACHANDLHRCVHEVLELARTTEAVLEWARGRKDALVVVTADHETGGLRILEPAAEGRIPKVAWSTGGHTGAAVPVYAWGAGARRVRGRLDNTDLFEVMTGLAKPKAQQAPAKKKKPRPKSPAPAGSAAKTPAY